MPDHPAALWAKNTDLGLEQPRSLWVDIGHVAVTVLGLERRRAAVRWRGRVSPSGWVVVAFVGAIAVCVPAWHVVTGLLSDSYMTLYTGRWIAAHGIPHREVFTVAAGGRAWIDQQWLAELVDYEAWRVGGFGFVGLFNGLVIGGAYATLAALIRRRGASVVLTVACSALALFVAMPALFIRAQDLALPLFALLLALCLTDAEHAQPRRRIVLVVPLLVLWANLHGSVLLGAGLAFAYLAYRGVVLAARGDWRTALGLGVLAVLAALTPLATPYGLHIVTYYRELMGNPAVAAAAPENRPASLSDMSFLVPLLLTIVTVTVSAVRRQRISVPLIGAVVVTAIATILASRSTIWFGMTAAVLLGCTVQAWLPTQPPTRGFLTSMALAATGITVLGVGLLLSPPGGGYERLTPLTAISAAATYATEHPATNVLADNAASSALLWHDPQLAGRVAYDARLERYSDPSLERWIRFQMADGNDWQATTNGYQTLIGSSSYNRALVRRLATMPGARVLVHDASGIAVVSN
jgi:hypothetical protein